MQNNPLISIIIPLFNREELIKDTLNSLLNQTYNRWECVIVDDGSTDLSFDVVKNFCHKDSRIRLLKRDRLPKGAPTCRNIALEKSKGDYIIFLDSDDLLAANCLENRILRYKENLDLDFIVFKSLLFNDSKNKMAFNKLWNISTEEDDLLRFLRFDAVWQTAGPIYKREFALKFPFTEGLPFLQDADLGIKMLLSKPAYKKCFDEAPDLYIRWENESISRVKGSSSDRFIKNLEVIYKIQQQVQKNTYKFNYQKQFVYTYYKLSKESFNHKNTTKLCLTSINYLLKIFPLGYLLYLPLLISQGSLLILRKTNKGLLAKIRVQLRNNLDIIIHRVFHISKPTLFKIPYKNE
ncbi:glycosyltransferase family 2 protein [Formosa sediminum]|uniref:Glycosyltransferase family 2 protein n=1 Tax=Formosa sediminum TaxID=2594004 RepID=A0A516GQ98_9FLAO|nr:glycosyltransferase family 2 protein [Formosa sediminum]QDO93686.1 glycosyltransferase family 2 protein [Formosa sediminum]